VKVAVLPLIFQDPAVSGEILGSGVLADSGAEKPTVMGLVPLTVPAPEWGMNEATSIAGAGVTTGFGVALAPDGPLCRDAATDVVRTVVWPGPTASTTRPATSTSTAAAPVITTDLLARERPVPRCTVRRRNQPEYDTPSPRSLSQN
jgi:hypothetical protein